MSSESGIRVLDDPQVLRLIADPLRLRILELLRQEPRTVTELAGLLGVARTRLYYHVRLLESHDLVAVAETQVVAGITEKRYRVTAYRLSVDTSLLGPASEGDAPLEVFLSVVLDEVAAEIRRAVASGLIDLGDGSEQPIAPGRMTLGRDWYRLTDEEVRSFADAYAAFMRPFADREVGAPGRGEGIGRSIDEDESRDTTGSPRRLYEWLIGFYPVVPPHAPDRGTA